MGNNRLARTKAFLGHVEQTRGPAWPLLTFESPRIIRRHRAVCVNPLMPSSGHNPGSSTAYLTQPPNVMTHFHERTHPSNPDD